VHTARSKYYCNTIISSSYLFLSHSSSWRSCVWYFASW